MFLLNFILYMYLFHEIKYCIVSFLVLINIAPNHLQQVESSIQEGLQRRKIVADIQRRGKRVGRNETQSRDETKRDTDGYLEACGRP